MLTQDRAAKATKHKGNWELYERLNGGPNSEKDVVLVNTSENTSFAIQREEFKEIVQRYFDIKGY